MNIEIRYCSCKKHKDEVRDKRVEEVKEYLENNNCNVKVIIFENTNVNDEEKVFNCLNYSDCYIKNKDNGNDFHNLNFDLGKIYEKLSDEYDSDSDNSDNSDYGGDNPCLSCNKYIHSSEDYWQFDGSSIHKNCIPYSLLKKINKFLREQEEDNEEIEKEKEKKKDDLLKKRKERDKIHKECESNKKNKL